MKRTILSIVVTLSAALSCFAEESAAPNIISNVVSVAAATNVSVVKVSRQQCEAVTKSGNRCKRNAALGEKLCRQHLKIANRKSGGSAAAH